VARGEPHDAGAARLLHGLTPLPAPAPLPDLAPPEDVQTETLTAVRRDSGDMLRGEVHPDWRTPLPSYLPQAQATAPMRTPLPKPISEVRELGRRRPTPAPSALASVSPPRQPVTSSPPPRTRAMTPVPAQPQPNAHARDIWNRHPTPTPLPGTMMHPVKYSSGFQPSPQEPRSETCRTRASPLALQHLQRRLRMHEEVTRATPVNPWLLELTRQARNRPALVWFLFGSIAGAFLVVFLHSDLCFSLRLWAANALRSAKSDPPVTHPVATAPVQRAAAPVATVPAAPPPTTTANALALPPPQAATFAPVAPVVPQATPAVAMPQQPMPQAPLAASPQVAPQVDVNQLPKAEKPAAPPRRAPAWRPRPRPHAPAPAAPKSDDDEPEDLLSGALSGGSSSSSSSSAGGSSGSTSSGSSGGSSPADLFSQALGD
jgi:uncharacterized membrane protein YgcG